jgi:inosine-uridine nucleoside N-ribohydrolase
MDKTLLNNKRNFCNLVKLVMMITLFAFTGCSHHYGDEEQQIKIIFDTDMGSDCDDVGALALLHHYASEGRVEILGCIYSSGRVPYGAGIIDAINRYYRRQDIPIGACQQDCIGDPVDKMQAQILAENTKLYGNKIVLNTDAIEQTRLNRMLLASQEDGAVTYLTVGHTQGLYMLLKSQGDDISPLSGMELVKKKVCRWVALGALGANNDDGKYVQDWNFYRNETAPYTEYLVEHFPNESYFVHAGANVLTGASLAQTPKGNIVRDAYETWLQNTESKKLTDQRPSWDLAATYFAVRGTGEFLEEEEEGRLEFDKTRGSLWIKGEVAGKNNHFYIQQKEGVDELFADYLNERIALIP